METEPVKANVNKKLVIIIALVGAVIIGGMSIGYSYFMRSPEWILSEMLDRWTTAKTFEYSAKIEGRFDNPQSPEVPGNPAEGFGGGNPFFGMNPSKEIEFSVALSGVSDNNNKDPKGSLLIDMSSASLAPFTLALKTELRIFNETIYFKLNKGTSLGFIDARQVSGQWVKADLKELIPKEEHKRFKKSQQEILKRHEKIDKMLNNSKLFKLTEVLKDDNIAGRNVYNFKFELDKKEVKPLFKQIMKELEGKTPTKAELKDMDQELDDMLSRTQSAKGQIWIGKSDLLPYKITLNLGLVNPVDPKAKGNIEITLSYNNFNKPVKIEVPAKTVPMKDFTEKMFPLFPGLEPDHKHMPDGVTPIGPDGKPLMMPPGDIPPQELMPDGMPFMLPPGAVTPDAMPPQDMPGLPMF